jgi:3',5'-cyclic AMP phosphodiesterase CpdA
MPLKILHVSDLHFGRSSVARQVAGVERLFEQERFDLIVISGDLSQRTRTHEFEQARAFIESAEQHAPVIVVPGNHDTAWWTAPMGIGSRAKMYERYQRFIREELEPVVRIPGATIVGLNSAHGVQPWTLTTRPRDISVVGALRASQFEKAKREFDSARASDLKVLVFHHNLLRGELSNRWGLANRARGIAAVAATGADLVLCGHDHEPRVEDVTVGGRKVVVACASTLTTRVRGGGPGAINVVEVDDLSIQVNVLQWNDAATAFGRVMWARYTRMEAA